MVNKYPDITIEALEQGIQYLQTLDLRHVETDIKRDKAIFTDDTLPRFEIHTDLTGVVDGQGVVENA
jgi:hypothetical protein